MNLDEIVNLIRELAKSSYWQSIYSSAKEVRLKIFENDIDLTEFQVLFLNYLAFYSSLNLDVSMGDVENFVLDNFIYEDAYMLYKREKKYKTDIDTKIGNNKSPDSNNSIQWVFKKPSKKVK